MNMLACWLEVAYFCTFSQWWIVAHNTDLRVLSGDGDEDGVPRFWPGRAEREGRREKTTSIIWAAWLYWLHQLLCLSCHDHIWTFCYVWWTLQVSETFSIGELVNNRHEFLLIFFCREEVGGNKTCMEEGLPKRQTRRPWGTLFECVRCQMNASWVSLISKTCIR